MTRYLLGMLPEEEQVQVEQEFLAADDYYEGLLVIEDELTYRWLGNDLSPEEQRRFESRFLSSGRGRSKAAFARALVDTASRLASAEGAQRGVRRTFRLWSLAFAAASIVAVSLVFLLVQTRQLRTQIAVLESRRQEERGRRAALEQEVARLRQPAVPPVAFLLLPGSTRGTEELRRLQIPNPADTVRFELLLKRSAAYPSFSAALRTGDGREVWSQGGLAASGRRVVVTVPASVLPKDEYVLALQGQSPSGEFEDAAEYHFSVSRRPN